MLEILGLGGLGNLDSNPGERLGRVADSRRLQAHEMNSSFSSPNGVHPSKSSDPASPRESELHSDAGDPRPGGPLRAGLAPFERVRGAGGGALRHPQPAAGLQAGNAPHR